MDRLFSFAGGSAGIWHVTSARTLAGESLPPVAALAVSPAGSGATAGAEPAWLLRGITSHERYTSGDEKTRLTASQQGLGRAASTCAALIPLRKNAAWWALPQDARREILEDRSDHIRIGLRYLPAIARRLYHCRDLSESEPFDFLTWFEYAPADRDRFDDLVAALRASEEWRYVDRDIDIRLERAATRT
ncbi:chlorite dismutase family protein [Burkholderia perseverans]|uniref:chlorite dismutase family protein n=1 Tax=Burkholderia perseverans TaxID=2615214 RepID=UPI001FED551E|nr:chlorite dismutase family protein [Burkholderia perseverans]